MPRSQPHPPSSRWPDGEAHASPDRQLRAVVMAVDDTRYARTTAALHVDGQRDDEHNVGARMSHRDGLDEDLLWAKDLIATGKAETQRLGPVPGEEGR